MKRYKIIILVVGVSLLVFMGAFSFYLVKYYQIFLNAPTNSILIIRPYKYGETWVFDDAQRMLKRESFVAGVPKMIDKLVEDIPDANKGFRLLFSANPFPGYEQKLIWRRAESGGNWYYSQEYDMEGWLCPALFKYFRKVPKEIFVKAESLSSTQPDSLLDR